MYIDKRIVLMLPVFILLAGKALCEDKESLERNKASVVNQIKDILEPSKLKAENVTRIVDSKPYIKIVKGADERSTIFYRCRFTKSRAILDAIESMISRSGTVEESADQNMVIVNDVHTKIPEVEKCLLAIDVPAPQILVEAKIVEVQLNDGSERDLKMEYSKQDHGDGINENMGYSLDAPSQNPLTGQGFNFDMSPYSSGWAGQTLKRMNLVMRWLKNARNAKILSAPNLVVDLGATASIITGEDIPIQQSQVTSGTISTSVEFRRIGVKLNVTPLLINDNNVSMEVNPEVSSVTRFQTFIQNGEQVNNPVISIRNINTKLNVVDGEVIMLGGLYSSEKVESTRKTPILGDLPIVGELFTAKFTSNVRTQLIFLLKISILDPEKSGEGVFYKPDGTAQQINELGKAIENSDDIFSDRNGGGYEDIKEVKEKENQE